MQPSWAGRALDDNAHVMMRYEGGAPGLLWSSQVALGNSNGVRLRVFGDKGSFQWYQEQPNELIFTPLNGRVQVIKRGADDLSEDTKVRTRTPPGHHAGKVASPARSARAYRSPITD